MRILTVFVPLLLAAPLVAQTPAPAHAPASAPAAPTPVKGLTAAQVQQATRITARAAELDRDHAAAIKALEDAAAKLTQIKQQQAELNALAGKTAPTLIAALGGDPQLDTFDWGRLALRPRPAPTTAAK